jgi:hypothetical protein
VIRGWLGHGNLETTNRYAEITVRMRVAMKLCTPPTVSHDRGKAGWRDDAALLTWLASLWRRRWGWTQRLRLTRCGRTMISQSSTPRPRPQSGAATC